MTVIEFYKGLSCLWKAAAEQVPANGTHVHFDGFKYEVINQDWFYTFNRFSQSVELSYVEVYLKEVL